MGMAKMAAFHNIVDRPVHVFGGIDFEQKLGKPFRFIRLEIVDVTRELFQNVGNQEEGRGNRFFRRQVLDNGRVINDMVTLRVA